MVFYTNQHFVYLLKKIFPSVVGFLASFCVFLIWFFAEKAPEISLFSWNFIPFLADNFLIFFLFFLWGIIHIHSFFLHFFNYLFDIIIVTDARFLDIEESVFFTQNREAIDLAKVQDIQAHKNGVLETLFNYGVISLTFANIIDKREFSFIPDPVHFTEYLHQLKRRLIYKHEQLDEVNMQNNSINSDEEEDTDNEVVI